MMNIAIIEGESKEAGLWMNSIRHISADLKCTHFDSRNSQIQQIGLLGPDFIFCNLALPFTSGLYYLAASRNSSRLSDVKFYLYGVHITDETAKMAQVLGAHGCIERSRDLLTFRRHLRAILGHELMPKFALIR